MKTRNIEELTKKMIDENYKPTIQEIDNLLFQNSQNIEDNKIKIKKRKGVKK